MAMAETANLQALIFRACEVLTSANGVRWT